MLPLKLPLGFSTNRENWHKRLTLPLQPTAKSAAAERPVRLNKQTEKGGVVGRFLVTFFMVIPLYVAIASFGLGCIVTIIGALVGKIEWAIFWPCVGNTVAISVGFSYFLYVVATCLIAIFISPRVLDNERAIAAYNGPFVDGVLRSMVFLICIAGPFITASFDGALFYKWPI